MVASLDLLLCIEFQLQIDCHARDHGLRSLKDSE